MLAEEWDGTTWAVTSALPVSISESWDHVDAVACPTTTHCLAVGQAGGCCGQHSSITLSWSTTGWTDVASPAAGQVALSGISCPTASACVAVGSSGPTDDEAVPVEPIVWT